MEEANMKKILFRGEELLAEPPIKAGEYKLVNMHPILTPEEKARIEKQQYTQLARLLMN